jgi:hypothetical protein
MEVANDVIPDQCPVRLFDTEVKNARPFVIDPDDGVVMIGHCGLLAGSAFDPTAAKEAAL